jgi:hypothetical protein
MNSKHPDYTGNGAKWSLIPDYMIGGLCRYIENGIEPGSFLSAVLCNDLRAACECADDTNRHRLFEYVQFLYSYAPASCWGSQERFEKWLDEGGLGFKEVYRDDSSVVVLTEQSQ